jgi:hypothetical protein
MSDILLFLDKLLFKKFAKNAIAIWIAIIIKNDLISSIINALLKMVLKTTLSEAMFCMLKTSKKTYPIEKNKKEILSNMFFFHL